jgi:hypothetical protein
MSGPEVDLGIGTVGGERKITEITIKLYADDFFRDGDGFLSLEGLVQGAKRGLRYAIEEDYNDAEDYVGSGKIDHPDAPPIPMTIVVGEWSTETKIV